MESDVHSRSTRTGDYNGRMTPIPSSREVFARIAPFARIPSVYTQLLQNSTAMNTFAVPVRVIPTGARKPLR